MSELSRAVVAASADCVAPVCEPLETRRLFSALVHQELHRPPTAIADVNGDRLEDLIVVTARAAEGTTVGSGGGHGGSGGLIFGFDLYLNDGNGSFRLHGHTDCDDTDPGVFAADIAVANNARTNGDGSTSQWPILALKLYSVTGQPTPVGEAEVTTKVITFEIGGRGEFEQRTTFVLPHVLETSGQRWNTDPYAEDALRGVGIGDLDGDGLGDIVSWVGDELVMAMASEGGEYKTGPAQANPLFKDSGTSGQNPLYQQNRVIGLGDLDGDGHADLVGVVGDTIQYLSINFSPGLPTTDRVNKIEALTIKQGTAVHLGDVDGDGFGDDLVLIEDQHVRVGINEQTTGKDGRTPTHSFSWIRLEGPLTSARRELLIGDVDGDGYDELFTISNVSKARHEVAMNSIRNMKA